MVEESHPSVSHVGNDVTFLQVIGLCRLEKFLLLPSSYKSPADQVEVMREGPPPSASAAFTTSF